MGGSRKVIIKQSVADSLAQIAWFTESEGLVATAEKFVDDAYDFFLKLSDSRKSYALCREPERALLGFKCISYKRKYTVVFIETEEEVIVCEFISTKRIYW